MDMPVARVANADEEPALLRTLTLGFATDPVARFGWPDAASFMANFPLFAQGASSKGLAEGSAWTVADHAGVAVWLPPGVEPDEAVMMQVVESLSPEKQVSMGAAMAEVGGCHPEGPHWYLPTIAVDPFHQGRGLGSILMKAGLQRVDQDHLPAFLESSNPRNISIYLRHGFEVVAEVPIEGGPVFTAMLRAAR